MGLVAGALLFAARATDFMLSEAKTRNIKDQIVELYFELPERFSISSYGVLSMRYLSRLLSHLHLEHIPIGKRAIVFFAFSFIINALFWPWISNALSGYADNFLTSPNYAQRSGVSLKYIGYGSFAVIAVQALFDTASIIVTLAIIKRIYNGLTTFLWVALDIVCAYAVWLVSTAASIFVTQIAGQVLWLCYGSIATFQYGAGDEPSPWIIIKNKCDVTKLPGEVFSSPRVGSFVDLIIANFRLDFSFEAFNAGDLYLVNNTAIAVMNMTTIWPTLIYLFSLFFILSIVTLTWLIGIDYRIAIHRLEEIEGGFFTKIALFFIALIGVFVAYVKLAGSLVSFQAS